MDIQEIFITQPPQPAVNTAHADCYNDLPNPLHPQLLEQGLL